MKSWKTHVAVLCIFFIRDDCFAKSFESVREARPRVLLLWQDGPRENRPDDLIGIEKCRRIAHNIDWECEVHRFYNTKNYGCDPSTFYSHKWAFSIVDKCIVLEDDVVPAQSFYPYCIELLNKYENDTRINRICGMNNVPDHKCKDSYLFSSVGSVWGWATWKRVAESWEEYYDFLEDEDVMSKYLMIHSSKADKAYLKKCIEHKKDGVAHWEKIQTFSRHLNHQLNIVPCVNLIHNVGLGDGSTHSNTTLDLMSKQIRDSFYGKAGEISLPLRHPRYIIEDVSYKKELFHITGRDSLLIRAKLRLISILLRIRKSIKL